MSRYAVASRLALGLMLASSLFAAGCAADPASSADEGDSTEDALAAKADEHWIYAGPLPALKDAKITVSLAGNTAHVVGYMPAGAEALPSLPHVKTKLENGRTRVDIVYPIATAAPPKTNSKPGTYSFYEAKPYRPDGLAYTVSAGSHFVPWGGFPFLGYNNGIAFHGPITSQDNKAPGDMSVWYLRRGSVSSGCNRMLGENVIELAHVLGISMRKVYGSNQSYPDPTAAKVTVIADYDMLDGKYIDVDYATDVGLTRPGKVHGDANVVMFGSWVATEMPNGQDLPPDQLYEGGVAGKPYVFSEHARTDMVCSFAKADLPGLKNLVRTMGGELPRSVCAKKQCIVDALHANKDAKAACSL
jgi:hypothetical protein